VEALQSQLEGKIKAMQQAAGAQDVGLLGVDVEEMVSRIEEQRKRLKREEISPAEFAEESSAIAAEYRKEIEKIIDRAVELTTLTEEQGKRMKRGLGVARDEAQKRRSCGPTSFRRSATCGAAARSRLASERRSRRGSET
jgi:KaiC/GvpD/RAD55 family RecA-like ATPase